MRTAYHEQLDALTAQLGDMCGKAGAAMERATQALLQADLALAEQVITDHEQISAMSVRAEEAAFVLLALQAPVAGDLRSIVGSIQIVADVDRMGALDKLREDGTDEVLMLRVGQGDEPAFQLLVRRHLPRSIALARRMTASASDAEEIAQEAFLRVWTSAPRWRAEGAAFRTWLYRIVVNLCLDRGRRKPFMPLEDAGDPSDPTPDALAVLEQQETARRVAAAVEALPDRQRAALVLSYYEGMSNADAASVLGVSVSSLEALLVRARRALRGRLDESVDGRNAAGGKSEA